MLECEIENVHLFLQSLRLLLPSQSSSEIWADYITRQLVHSESQTIKLVYSCTIRIEHSFLFRRKIKIEGKADVVLRIIRLLASIVLVFVIGIKLNMFSDGEQSTGV